MSTFIRNFDVETAKIKEIIASPANVSQYLENLKIIHNSIENMFKQYKITSIKAIKKELYEAGIKMSEIYKTSIKNDLPSHIIQTSYTLPFFQEPKFKLELFEDDIYDELFEYVDENIDISTREGQKMIAKFYVTKNEIENKLSESRQKIVDFEQNLVNFRDSQLQNIKNVILPTLYKAHMSFVKCASKESSNKCSIMVDLKPGITITVSGRQTEFIPKTLLSWLSCC